MNTFLFTCLYIHLHIYRHPWDIWSSLALNILPRPERWPCPYSLYFFFLIKFYLSFFFLFFLTTSPLEMALCCDCATTDLWCCFIHLTGSLASDSYVWDDHNIRGIDEKVLIGIVKQWKCGMWQWIVKSGIIIWFDVSLWHKYETTCQHAELAQIISFKRMFKMFTQTQDG